MLRAGYRVFVSAMALMALAMSVAAGAQSRQPRPRVGVAFGGGSARGLAHVGVVRWFEEHHIPIDVIAGTSMGGLIGGGFAAGMSADELSQLLDRTNWDEMFGFSSFQYKNVRRKEDARDYPSRIEFGLKRGLALPLALNSGQQVDFLLARIAGPYMSLASFDELPTPFRAVAVDLVTAQQVILDKGALASAMRATMSLPGIFPPVERDGMVLVDGGAMNNVPADVVRAMGADTVIAVDVGFMGDTRTVSRSMLGLMTQTVDTMMQANTRRSLASADIVINPTLTDYDSLDWRRSAELAVEGYRARRGDERQAVAARGERRRVGLVPAATPGAAQDGLAGSAVRHGVGGRCGRRRAHPAVAGGACGTAARCRRARSGSRKADGPRSL